MTPADHRLICEGCNKKSAFVKVPVAVLSQGPGPIKRHVLKAIGWKDDCPDCEGHKKVAKSVAKKTAKKG
jgi:hypothetical protein